MTMNRNGSSWIAEPINQHHDRDDEYYDRHDGESVASSVYSTQESLHDYHDEENAIDASYRSSRSQTLDSSHRSNRSQSRQAPPRRRSQEVDVPPSSSRPRPPPRGFSRRASLGGTTIYSTPDMAKMDTFLRSSGLRLKPDGTCQFLFETTRFVIETTTDADETGEFLFYCSLGKLRSLRQNFGSQKNLLKMLAMWNEELQMAAQNDTGLLRIDSSKENGPHVSFIYYGQMENIKNSEEFQQLLDEFVDDALDFHDKLNTVDREDHEEHVHRSGSSLHVNERINVGGQNNLTGSAKSLKSNSTNTTASATVSSQSSEESGAFSNAIKGRGNSFHRAISPPVAASAANHATEMGSSFASLSTNTHDKNSKKSVFSKVMSTLRTKNDPTVAMAFIDPSNPTSAFVVDKTIAEEPVKPKLVISRKGVEKKGGSFHAVDSRNRDATPKHSASFHVDEASRNLTSRKGKSKSFHEESRSVQTSKRSSLPDVLEDSPRRHCSYVAKRSSQPSIGEDSYDSKHFYPKKSTSFHDVKKPMSDDPCRETKSFHHSSGSRRVSINPEESSDFSNVMRHIEKRTSHTSFNRSVDVFNDSGACEGNHNSSVGAFNYSEPVLPSHTKPKRSALRSKQVSVQPEIHSASSSSRRKTFNDVDRPKLTASERHRRSAYPSEDRATKTYYDRHNPPPPPPRSGSKWCMENVAHESDYESDEGSELEERLYEYAAEAH